MLRHRRVPAATTLATLFLAGVCFSGTPGARADNAMPSWTADAGTPGDAGTADGGTTTQPDSGVAAAKPAPHFLEPGEGRKKPGVVVFTQDFEVPEPDSVQPTMNFPFFARVDRVILTGQLKLLFAPPPDHSREIRSIDVLVNQEKIATFEWQDLVKRREPRTITIPPQLMGDRNLLTLKMLVDDEGPCGEVPDGVWRAVKSIRLVTEAAPLPVPNNLAQLPVPFVDRDFDNDAILKKAATIPFVLAPEVNESRLQNAGIISSWFGTIAAPTLEFPTYVNELPESSAVVLVDSADAAKALGLPSPAGAEVRMMDNPRYPNSNNKLLVLSGRTPEELAIAVHQFVAPNTALAGEVVRFERMPREDPAKPYDAPRWLPFRSVVLFDQYPVTPYSGTAALTLEGGRDGSIPLRFRVAPDLWSWPTEFVDLDLGYSEQLAPGVQPPRLDLDFNGVYLATLPTIDPAKGDRDGRAKLRVRAEQIRGFNEFNLHVHYPRQDGECDNGPANESRVSIAPDSSLHIEGFGHFAEMPDVATFVHDGYPFSRIADLGETAVVVPSQPQPPEIGTYLSMLAHIGTITGRVATRVQVMTADHFLKAGAKDKDLLVVGRFDNNAVLNAWVDKMPLVIKRGDERSDNPTAIVDVPAEPSSLKRLWHSALSYIDIKRAENVLFRERHFAAVVGIPAPDNPARNVVAVTATSSALMPSADNLTGVLDTRFRSGDVLISAGVQRWMFEIAPVHGSGIVSWWVSIRRFFSMQFPLLFPGMVLGSVLIAFQLRSGMGRRIKKRLGQD
jgi:hypothetical protein